MELSLLRRTYYFKAIAQHMINSEVSRAGKDELMMGDVIQLERNAVSKEEAFEQGPCWHELGMFGED